MALPETDEIGAAAQIFRSMTDRQLAMLHIFLQNHGPATVSLTDWERMATQLDYKTAKSCRDTFRAAFGKHGWFQSGADGAAGGFAPATPASARKRAAAKNKKLDQLDDDDDDNQAADAFAAALRTAKKEPDSASGPPLADETTTSKKGKRGGIKDEPSGQAIKLEDGLDPDDSDEV